MKPADILIVGSGAIGLFCARELALAGLSVALLDRGCVGGESSWAGGGIVSPLYPWRYPAAVLELSQYAQAAYPGLIADLFRETGVDPEYEACGMLVLDAPDVRDAVVWAEAAGRQVIRLGPKDLESSRWLSRGAFSQALWWPEQANVRNPRLVAALRRSVEHLGVRIQTDSPVDSFLMKAGRVMGVVLEGGRQVHADAVVVAAGAWSAKLLASVGVRLPIEPVRGQMLLFKASPGWLPSMVMHQGKYLIPRRDGHILAGSTLEYVGFEKQTTIDAKEELMDAAVGMVPALRETRLVAQWSGLRPGSPSGIPFIGTVPGVENLWLNAGHFRNGLVLAPASAKLMADLMLGRPTGFDASPYQVLV